MKAIFVALSVAVAFGSPVLADQYQFLSAGSLASKENGEEVVRSRGLLFHPGNVAASSCYGIVSYTGMKADAMSVECTEMPIGSAASDPSAMQNVAATDVQAKESDGLAYETFWQFIPKTGFIQFCAQSFDAADFIGFKCKAAKMKKIGE